tara:strand:- start:1033 stop:3867 length:2835 start_codon:yes stop_codon:yes gene_type:complete
MAVVYAVSEFTDDNDVTWKVKIVDGSISTGDLNHPFTLGPDGFRLNYGYDNFDRSRPILGSKVMLTLFHPDDNDVVFEALYDLLDSAEEGTYRIEIFRDPDGVNEAWWVGEILPEQVVIPDEYPSAAISITAVDGIANLKGIDYNNDGTAYEGTDLITAHLYKALSKVHSINFWGASATLLRFFEDFIGGEYKTYIDGAQNQQLNNAKIEHNTFHNPDSNGVYQYYSAYEVLESIALTLNASIFMAQGTYWLVPLGATQSHVLQDTLDIAHYINGAGVVTYNTAVNITPIVQFGTNNAYLEKLTGWERSSTPAFKNTKRTRNYQGDIPVLSTAYYNMPRVSNSYGLGALLADEDATQPIEREYSLTGTFQFGTIGISSLVGIDRVVRARLRFEIRVGDAGGASNYLNKDDATYDSSSVANAVWYGETYDNGYIYRLPQYSDTTWSSNSTNRYTWISEVFDGSNGNSTYPNSSQFYNGEQISFPLPPIPATANGVTIRVAIDFIGWNGNPITSVDFLSPTQNYSSWKITMLTLRVLDEEEVQEFGQVDIEAINPNDARYKFDQGDTLIGDQISDGSLGVIKVDEGTTGAGQGYVNASYWQNSQETSATNYSINGLGVRERLGANKSAKRTERGTLAKLGQRFIHPYTILQNQPDHGNYYQLTGLNYLASRSEYDIECIILTRNIDGITEAVTGRKPSKGDRPIVIGPYNPVTTKGPIDDTIQGENVTKLGFVSTDTYGIVKFTTSTGSSAIDINLPITKSSAGAEVVTINTLGAMAPLADGASGEFLKTNGSGVLSWAAAGSSGGGGWFGSATLLKVMPCEFMANDDAAGRDGFQGLYIEDDTSGYLGVRVNNVNTEMYVMKAIPTGYKATHVKVYGSTGVFNGVDVYLFRQTTGAIISKGTGDINALMDITDISGSTQNNISIKVSPGATTVLIYGVDITIATI